MRTPIILQLSETECGAACLAIVLAHHGRWVNSDELREACCVGRDGSTAADIVRAARRYGLEATGWRDDPAGLERLPLPAVLFWGFNHFVVLESITRSGYVINDPASGRRTVGQEEFSAGFTGVVLTMTPGPEFAGDGKRPGVLRALGPWLREVKPPLAFAAVCGALLAIPGLALPAAMSVFVDDVLTGRQPGWGPAVVGATAALALATYLLVWLQQRCLNRLAIRLSVQHTSEFVVRMLRLPLQFFAYRLAGDLNRRTSTVDAIGTTASASVTALAIELMISLVYLAAVTILDPLLALVILLIGAANAIALRYVQRARRDENQRIQRESVLLSGIEAFGLGNMETLKATAAQGDFFSRWSGQQARLFTAQQKLVEFGSVSNALPGLFQMLGNAVVLGFGGWRVMSGDLSLGVLLGLLIVTANMLRPIGRFVTLVDELALLDASLRQVNDVMQAQEDPGLAGHGAVGSHRTASLDGKLRLAGRVELRGLTFGYRPHRAPIIDDFSLSIEVGQRVAVVGPSGSGKSTLMKLLSGQYTAWSGEILYDGVPRSQIPREVVNSSVAVVDQQILLFSGSIRDNLTLWNPAVSDRHVAEACKDALLHDDIMRRESGYESHVDEAGRNFSGGQRQRMEIARALVSNPSVLVLDEATSSLDALTEARIDDALRQRGCTCLIVAHRLSTIRDCDLIVVLDRGREVQRGTHDELMADSEGTYRRLMRDSEPAVAQ